MSETKNVMSYAEIKNALKEPIDEKFISKKKVAGNDIRFVNVTDVKDLLDKRLGTNHWEVNKSEITFGGKFLYMTIYLTINAADGVFTQIGHGHCEIDLKGYGDPTSNAYAQALRRAAESHGLARELWREEISAEQWELPASAGQIKTLHEYVGILGKTENVCALHYSAQRTELFGELMIKEAAKAISELTPAVEKKKRENKAGAK